MPKPTSENYEASSSVLSIPPLSFGERFEDAYEVILVLDDREQFATQGSVTYDFYICHTFLNDEAS